MVGMSKSGSRYGRRSNWFKIHCLLQEQTHQTLTRLKDRKSPYEKPFSSLDAANNNTNTSASNNIPTGNIFQERIQKREEGNIRSQDIPVLRTPEIPRPQEMLRPPDIGRPHELLRPEAARFPMWRGPPFFHPALNHMQLLNTPFFPFQQRFIVPYVNQVGIPQAATSLSSSSSESISPRTTPSPTNETHTENQDSNHRDNCDTSRQPEVSYDKSVAFLRSLGPEQDEPIDLSVKNQPKDAEAYLALSEEERSSGSEDNDMELEAETGPPLDLTRRT